jgi:hypothetical protein
LQYFSKASATDELGVIGYQAHTVAPPYTQPSAAAALPSTKMLVAHLVGARTAGRCPGGGLQVVLGEAAAGCSARTFDSSSRSLPLYCSPNSFSMTAGSMSISTDSAPSTMMFLNSVRWRGSS